MQRPILIEIQHQHQLIILSESTGFVQVKLKTELSLQDCGEEGGAEGVVGAFQSRRFSREVEIILVSTERDER